MAILSTIAGLFSVLTLVASQNVTVPNTCTDGFTAGTSTALVTVPYTYDQVLSIIGDYQNLTWSGSPAGSVSLNGTDNTVGTARTYDIAGAHVIETILIYEKPPAPGPYYEVHNTALLTIPSVDNLKLYIPYDGTTVTSVCDGRASMFNFTAHFCASNGTAGEGVLTMLHTNDALTVGKFLGGMNFTSCAALSNATSSSGSMPSATMSGGPVAYTGASSRIVGDASLAGVLAGVVALLL